MDNTQRYILIVDDAELNRELIKQLFYEEYGILEAENGYEAVNVMKNNLNKIALVFLDIMMPVMNGFEVLEKMKVNHWIDKIPVILITAADSEDVVNRGYDLGATDLINKPFNPSIIRRRVHNIIELYDHRMDMERLIKQQTKKIEKQALKIKKSSLSLIDTLSTVVEFRDCESGQHIQRIRNITRFLLQEIVKIDTSIGFTPQIIDDISFASAMHDVGKITTPDYILNKPAKLTLEEFDIMKKHTINGCEILERVPTLREEATYKYYYEICRWHHERWDGKGYPDGLKGDEIPIWSQVVALADCYDALVSKRVYKPAFSHDKAITMILSGECGEFNPILLDSFRKIGQILGSIPFNTVEENISKSTVGKLADNTLN